MLFLSQFSAPVFFTTQTPKPLQHFDKKADRTCQLNHICNKVLSYSRQTYSKVMPYVYHCNDAAKTLRQTDWNVTLRKVSAYRQFVYSHHDWGEDRPKTTSRLSFRPCP